MSGKRFHHGNTGLQVRGYDNFKQNRQKCRGREAKQYMLKKIQLKENSRIASQSSGGGDPSHVYQCMMYSKVHDLLHGNNLSLR
ncbi:hypothetical protein BRARA_C02623 [Brassica rapa]|uniref:Uncharacterized protein n=1 Tax=Brassica campestris TaxID=3711 RepID=A0A397ZZP5_BRACM|nr:hypothetical protein BRARA_C02623 [Brassica rapa]